VVATFYFQVSEQHFAEALEPAPEAVGLERDSLTSSPDNDLRNPADAGAAKSGAVGAWNPTLADPQTDPDVAEMVARWPELPAAVRQSILGLVRGMVRDGQ